MLSNFIFRIRYLFQKTLIKLKESKSSESRRKVNIPRCHNALHFLKQTLTGFKNADKEKFLEEAAAAALSTATTNTDFEDLNETELNECMALNDTNAVVDFFDEIRHQQKKLRTERTASGEQLFASISKDIESTNTDISSMIATLKDDKAERYCSYLAVEIREFASNRQVFSAFKNRVEEAITLAALENKEKKGDESKD